MNLTHNRIDEVTRKEILGDVDARTKAYSKGYSTRYKGVTKDSEVVFTTESKVTPGTTYDQKIRMNDYSAFADDDSMKDSEKVRLSVTGDLSVSCTCPAYKWWGYEYIMTELDANAGPDQTIYPTVRNPKLQGTVCKHLKVALQVLPNNYAKIAKDVKNKNFI